MECFAVLSVLLFACMRLASTLTLAESGPLGAQIPGSSNITLLNVTDSNELPSVCETTPCFPKCCPFGQSLVNFKCTPTNYTFKPVYSPGNNTNYSIFEEETDPFFMIIGEICKERYPLEPGEFVLLYNGTMVEGITDENGTFLMYLNEDSWLLPNEYCLDTLLNPSTGKIATVPILCDHETRMGAVPIHVVVYPIGLLVSVCFLLLTMFIYLAIPDLRDLQGMALLCHLSCQALAYLFLASVQLSSNDGFGETGCIVIAYIIQFLFSASFFWLNVLCFDATWCVIVATLPEKNPAEPRWWGKLHYPGVKKWGKVGNTYMAGREECDVQEDCEKKQKEITLKKRVFLYYSLYAWFFSLLPVILVLAKRFGPTIPNTYLQYNMVSYNCNFQNLSDINSLPYFYIPVGTILTFNLIMFIPTMVKSCSFPWNVTGPHRIPRQKARMCYMLFFMMAMNWLTDIISWGFKTEEFTWSVLNVFNLLQGLVTFFIFVLEDRVKLLIVKKLWPNLKSMFKAKHPCCDIEQPQETGAASECTIMLQHCNNRDARSCT